MLPYLIGHADLSHRLLESKFQGVRDLTFLVESSKTGYQGGPLKENDFLAFRNLQFENLSVARYSVLPLQKQFEQAGDVSRLPRMQIDDHIAEAFAKHELAVAELLDGRRHDPPDDERLPMRACALSKARGADIKTRLPTRASTRLDAVRPRLNDDP